MRTMQARFEGDTVTRLLPIYIATEASRLVDCTMVEALAVMRERIWPVDGVGKASAAMLHRPIDTVEGVPQEVMFFIGFVAGNGEDGLLSVHPGQRG